MPKQLERLLEQQRQLEPKRLALQQQERQRQQLVLELVQLLELEQLQRLELEPQQLGSLLFCCKQPKQQPTGR